MMSNCFRKTVVFLLIGIGFAMLTGNSNAAANAAWSETRDLQPMVIPAESIPEALGATISQLYLYAYSSATQAWQQIPFQIDEKGWEVVEDYHSPEDIRIDTLWTFFGEKDDVLETGDEICFMIRDMGNRAAETEWLSNDASRLADRYEIAVTDPLDPTETRYVYLYSSATIQKSPFVNGYLDYTAASTDSTGDDIIYGKSYIEGHDLEGMIDYWAIPFSSGGTGDDILDRVKYRVNVSFGFTIRITEDKSLAVNFLQTVKGPIRVIRQINYWLVFPLFSDPIGATNFTSYYYPYHIDARGPSQRLSSEWGINYMRQSFDLNANAVGMKIYNPHNSGVLVDGVDDTFDKTAADYPQFNWHIVTGNQGSFFMSFVLPDIGDTRELYYHDNSAGGTDDGTSDTGDSQSFGDLGMAIRGTGIAGSFGTSYLVYFMEANVDPALGPQFVSNEENPLVSSYGIQTYDMTAPATITDLLVTDYTTESLTLRWTAPGDDGPAGDRIDSYDLRYSRFPVADDTLLWWNTASQSKRKPFPVTPGQVQTFVLTGLDAFTNYHVMLRAVDDAGNWSGFSNIASGSASPVELVSFQVEIENRQPVLRWETASETNNLGFDVQRRVANSIGDWESVAFLDGAGTLSTNRRYIYVDEGVVSGEYEYRLKQIDTDGAFAFSKTIRVNLTVPTEFALRQNYPNPFNSETGIGYQVARSADEQTQVRVIIYSVTGRRVRTLIDGKHAPGSYQVQWDSRDDLGQSVAAGIYLIRMHAGEFQASKKLLFIK